MRRVFIVGFMGAGKSTVGRLVAEHLGLPFQDLDARIEARTGSSIGELFDTRGEEAFRELETGELALVAAEAPAVIACGGGVVIRDVNRRILKEYGVVVYLSVTAGEALARVGDVSSRPLLAHGGPGAAQTLLAARESLYRAVADLTVETVGSSPADVAGQVLDALGPAAEA